MSVKNSLPRSTSELLGIPSSAVQSFIEAIEKNKLELHSFMLLRHGQVAAEGWWSPYRPERPHMLFSLSKSFTSTAVGLAVAEGYLTVEDPVISFFPGDVPAEAGEKLAAMRVKHLLSMSTGHAKDTMEYIVKQEEGNWVRGFLSAPVEYQPGTHFLYNNGASYMLSAIVQKVTGKKVVEYLQPRLFEPLGIGGETWETSPQGVNTGGWGLNIKTEDIAKFGQLYLQKGMWNGRQILPQAWVEEATAKHISNGDNPESDWNQGYGYQFWKCRHSAFRGDGAFGQFCVVMPDQDAVLAITSGLGDMQAVLNLVWEHLLPAMAGEPLQENGQAAEKLKEKCSSLELPLPRMMQYSSTAGRISGKRFNLEENELKIRSFSFKFTENQCIVDMWDERGEHRVYAGLNSWLEGETTLTPRPAKVCASGTWSGEDTFILTIRNVEGPFCDTIMCRFEEDRIRMEASTNVAFGPREYPVLLGQIV